MNLSRRRFLQASAAAGAVTAAPALFAPASAGASGTGHTLVAVILRGGLDGLSAVVPRNDGRYRDNRRLSAVAASKLLPLDADFAFHPALEPLHAFYRSGHLAPVVGVGSASPSRSHFVQQSALDLGVDGLGHPTGWIARHLLATHGEGVVRGMSSGVRRSPALRGASGASAIAALDQFRVDGVADDDEQRLTSALRTIAGPGAFGDAADDAVATIETVSRVAESVRADAYPATSLGRSLADIAALVRADIGLEVAVVEVGGWDTHASQGGETGRLASALDRLASGVAAFLADLGERLDSTTVTIVSEFGRRVEENASGGTDHGRAGIALVAGGGIRGGRVLGDWPGIGPGDLDDGDVRVTTDVRDVFAEVVSARLGNPDLGAVFPGHRPSPVGLT